ncbi:hypothetical protein ABK040_008548 [Willaertia magna]
MSRQQQINGSFLFATNNVGGMQLGDLQNETINETKWNTLKFPENCKIIKKAVCGAEFVVICNEKNEIYYFGNFGTSDHFWNQIIIENNLKNNLKNLYANYSNLIIQLNNDNITIFKNDETSQTLNFENCGIKFIFTGPLSKQFIIVDDKNKIYEASDSLKEIDTSEIDNYNSNTIKCIGCASQAYLLVTSENKIYGYGSSTFGELGNLQPNLDKFQYMSTPFEKESEIIDVKGGYYHFVVLLKSGIVYAIGYNSLGAANVYNQNNVTQFTKLTHPLFENEFINRIYCSSRGTVLITNSNNAYFIGEVVYALTGYECEDNNDRINNSMIDNGIESYKVNGNTIQKVKLSDEYNDVLAGGWHYIIYNNSNLNKSKSLQYFENKLSNLIKEQYYNDISITLF